MICGGSRSLGELSTPALLNHRLIRAKDYFPLSGEAKKTHPSPEKTPLKYFPVDLEGFISELVWECGVGDGHTFLSDMNDYWSEAVSSHPNLLMPFPSTTGLAQEFTKITGQNFNWPWPLTSILCLKESFFVGGTGGNRNTTFVDRQHLQQPSPEGGEPLSPEVTRLHTQVQSRERPLLPLPITKHPNFHYEDPYAD